MPKRFTPKKIARAYREAPSNIKWAFEGKGEEVKKALTPRTGKSYVEKMNERARGAHGRDFDMGDVIDAAKKRFGR